MTASTTAITSATAPTAPTATAPAAVRDIFVIGASAGGVESLMRLVSRLPRDLPAALFVVVHIGATARSHLPAILARAGTLPAEHARDGEAFRHGRIYVAPPDNHLVVEDSTLCLYQGPKENYCRPAIDVLFRSAANRHGARVVGVVLSGALYDGTAGLMTIKRCGGVAIVQDPQEAQFAAMPQSAVSRDHPDHVLPLSQIASTLVRLAARRSDTTNQADANRTNAAGAPAAAQE